MMNVRVDIVSRETIKPSSPTPHHLKNFNPCLLDQISPPYYMPLTLFYPKISDNNNIIGHEITSTRLKKSLSEALTRFFPLAGRVKSHLHIDCNDEGALYYEARVNCNLSQFLEQRKMELLNHFLPCDPYCDQRANLAAAPHVAVQVTVFDCGGIAISICLLHKLTDATLFSTFLYSWAAISRGAYDEVANVNPNFTLRSSLFPPRDSIPEEFLWALYDGLYFNQDRKITRRFVFDGKAIATLQAKAKSESVTNPTRIQTLTGFIWKCVMSASSVVSGSRRSSVLIHALSTRPRLDPPIPNYAIGNFTWFGVAAYDTEESEDMELHGLVSLINEGIVQVNTDSLKEAQGVDGFEHMYGTLKVYEEMVTQTQPDIFAFTSWCRLGWNDTDFGWGKPVWVGLLGDIALPSRNMTIFKETKCGGGIEAWVILNEKEMAALENDPHFLAFASLNPPILSSDSLLI